MCDEREAQRMHTEEVNYLQSEPMRTNEIHDMIQSGRKDVDYVLNIAERMNDLLARVEARAIANEKEIDRLNKALVVERVYNLINGAIAVDGKRVCGQQALDYLSNMSMPDLFSMWKDLELLRPNNRAAFDEAVKQAAFPKEQTTEAEKQWEEWNQPSE